MTADDSAAGKLAREIAEAMIAKGFEHVFEDHDEAVTAATIQPILARFIEERERNKPAYRTWVAASNRLIARAEKAEAEAATLRAAITDIDAHATPLVAEGEDSPHAYLVSAGALHRALGQGGGGLTAAHPEPPAPVAWDPHPDIETVRGRVLRLYTLLDEAKRLVEVWPAPAAPDPVKPKEEEGG